MMKLRRLLVALFLLVALPCNAEVKLDMEGCVTYAVWTHDVLWARDVGADQEKVRGSLVEYQRETENPIFQLMLRDLDKLWLTSVPREALAQAVARDCARRRGVYGPEI